MSGEELSKAIWMEGAYQFLLGQGADIAREDLPQAARDLFAAFTKALGLLVLRE